MGEWVAGLLSDLIELKRGYDLPQQSRQNGNIPIVSSSGVSGFHDKAMVSGPGVVTGRYGTIGIVYFIQEDFWPLNTTLYVKDFKGNDPRFVSYFLQGIDFFAYSDKAAVPGLNRNHLHTAPIRYPRDRHEQISIASVLGALDDKIKLNRQMNETLESMAQAIFKDWFVDFGPTRAKMDGRAPYLAPDIWSLFPARLDDEGKPDGWSIDSIYKIADVIYGAPFSSKLFNAEKLGRPLIRIRDLQGESPGVWTPENHPKGYMVTAGDVVVGMDGEFRAYLWGGDEAWLNQRLCVFKPKAGYSPAFVRNSIIGPLAHVEATEIATTVIHLGKNDIDRFSITLPNNEINEQYSFLCQPLYDQIVANKIEARALASMRDLLLPKLMSGEIRIKDAEKLVGKAT